jgi:hypothetical protein
VGYSVSEADGFVEIRFTGATSLDELIQLVAELVGGDPIAHPAAFLVDLTQIEHSDIDYAALTRILDYRESLPTPDGGSRIAIVASEPHLFGMGRMVELRTSAHARTARAFHERKESEAWLIEGEASP